MGCDQSVKPKGMQKSAHGGQGFLEDSKTSAKGGGRIHSVVSVKTAPSARKVIHPSEESNMMHRIAWLAPKHLENA